MSQRDRIKAPRRTTIQLSRNTFQCNYRRGTLSIVIQNNYSFRVDGESVHVCQNSSSYELYYTGSLCVLDRGQWVDLLSAWGIAQQDVSPLTYKRWICHSELMRLCKLCRTSPPPAIGARFTVFWACRPCGPAGWLALLLTKAGDVETNPGPTTLNKKVWICDICHRQIHVRKQISIRCNRIEHWVHNTQIPGPAIYTENPDSHLTQP